MAKKRLKWPKATITTQRYKRGPNPWGWTLWNDGTALNYSLADGEAPTKKVALACARAVLRELRR